MDEDRLKALRDRAELLHENLATLCIRNKYHFERVTARSSASSCHFSVALSADLAEEVRAAAFENQVSASSITEVALRSLFAWVGDKNLPEFLEMNGAARRRSQPAEV